MKSRCLNPNVVGFDRYGGRGIMVCDRWLNDFSTFLADLGCRPSPTHTLDRINPDGHYEPENCRWATKREQANNRRDNKIEIDGRRMSVPEAVRTLGLSVNIGTVYSRLRDGWSIQRALHGSHAN
jgi:hypothetical protein